MSEADPFIDVPPIILGKRTQRYDSVQGNSGEEEGGDSKCFVIYNKDKVYPQYLITY